MELIGIEKRQLDGGCRMTGTIRHGDGLEEELWFEFEGKAAASVAGDGTPWMFCLLPLACRQGENLRIGLPVDAEALHNARQIVRALKKWHPSFHVVDILPEETAMLDEPGDGRKIGCFFSGGVDSAFTVQSVSENLPGAKIGMLLTVWGFDMPLEREDLLDTLQRPRLAAFARCFGAESLVVKTNLRSTRLSLLKWEEQAFAFGLAAVGHFLRPELKQVYLSADYPCDDMQYISANPVSVPLFSSSAVRFTFYGSDCTRFEKTAFISRHPDIVDNLLVCWESKSAANCSRCLKCLITMTSLDALGVLTSSRAFRTERYSLEELSRMHMVRKAVVLFFTEIREHALAAGREDIADAIGRSLKRTRRQGFVRKVRKMLAPRFL